jgi:hypothetical protein
MLKPSQRWSALHRLAQRHNEALAKKPADNPRFKPAANVPGQRFVIVGTKR